MSPPNYVFECFFACAGFSAFDISKSEDVSDNASVEGRVVDDEDRW
eukprot:CAMPEP_0204916304 /NCGR_PEP_ID=MMETSP1397-20131031/14154_1 /ASSEMBLY_ACC=CAM_ASM_000891 /TAXON_ID=49980 /ORGANISM="Climacostomum Climacostomum virens, Strain Stock W-24" /LENGTH=45 /DNA_ID= /DNA_START= /DNA_END= /DNA_ORIENTATION=